MGSLRLATALLALAGLQSSVLGQCKTENFCTAFPNTTGSPALMGSNGLCAVPDNQFALQAGPVPNNFGLFFYSATVRNGGNGIPLGDGLLCIGEGAQLYRLPVLAAQNNQLDFSLDLTLPPAAGTIAAGTTWYFQAWYRDPGGAQSTFNFSDGLEVVFQAEQSPTVGFDLASQSLAEGDGSAILTVSLSSLSGLDVTVPYTVAGSASLPADGALAPDPLVIPAGSLSADLVLTLVDDGLDEADETVEVTLGAPTNAALGAGFVHTLTIQDNDVPPSVAFALMSASHGEGDGVAAALVELSAASGLDVSVPFTVTGSATVPDDLSVSASPLVIPAGQLSGAIQLNLVDDSFDEADESVELSLGAPTNASLGATIVHTATLTDDDAPPSVAFDQAVQVASEGAGVVGVTVVLSAISGQAVSVPFSVNGTADVPADATVDASPLVIPAGQLSGVIQVALVPDALNESAETVVLDLGAPTNASLGATATHTLTISDDDGLPTVSFASSSQSIGEAAGPQSVTVELSAVSGLDVTVPWTVSGTALDPDDVAVDDGPLVIPAGSLTGTFEVIPVSDGVDEPNETVVLDLGAPTNANKGAQDRHTVTILDDDAPPTITFTSAVQSAGEGAGAVAVAVQLDAPSGLEVSVPVLTSGAATVPGDATLSATTLVIPAGQQSANLTVTLVADSTFEADEELVLDLGAPSNATVGIPGQHTLTILDDDPAPQVAFSAPASSFAEGAGVVTVEVSLDTISGLDVTLPFSVGGSAGQPGDASVGASPVVVPAGVASATVSVTLVPDGLDEADETLVFDLGAPTGASLGTLTQHTLSIVDDDDPPAVTVTSSAQTAVEGAGGVTVTVALDGPSGLDVSVPFSATGSATAADVDVPASPVTITAGSTQTTLDLIVLQDVLDEPDEDLVVTLAAPTNGTLGSPFAHTLTIIDDDGPPSVAFVLANQSSGEGDGAITIDVSLSAVSGHAVTVPFTLAGDATPNVDYTADASPLVIPAGQTTGSITITPAADTSPESDETVELTLGAPTNATLGAPSVHVLTVLDDDVGLASDDFNDCAGLGSPWTFVDPLGGGTQRTTGVGTDDAWLRLGVPGGSNHEAFGGVLPARAQQPYPGGDTQFRASFPSSPSQAVEEQGLLVIEDTDYWIRFDVYHDGGELNAYVGRTTGASTTTMANLGLGAHSGRIDLRMTRSGDLWTAEWSADGATWNPVASFTFVFAPDQVGVYAGNAGGGNAPAFEASIDFFEVSADPILTEDGAFPGAGPYTMVTASA
ncbi:MAG: hypothetical protein O2816_01090, partial [Planctomycetota bacterium]|nr:hypothetical protein [Planctomycetota bacterium]